MQVVAKTDIGKVREINQDYVKVVHKSEDECLAVLCDGMGGHRAGEVASALACETIAKFYLETNDLSDEVQIRIWFYQAIMKAHHTIYEESQKNSELEGMGTTVVVVLVKNHQVYISHVGDSRVYTYHDNEFNQLTKDDTLVNALLSAGTISKEDALFHPQKNVLLQAVGVSDTIQPSFLSMEYEGMLLLCSDGLYNSLFDEQIIDIFKQNLNLEDICERLIEESNVYGGKDNIGIILINNKGENRA